MMNGIAGSDLLRFRPKHLGISGDYPSNRSTPLRNCLERMSPDRGEASGNLYGRSRERPSIAKPAVQAHAPLAAHHRGLDHIAIAGDHEKRDHAALWEVHVV